MIYVAKYFFGNKYKAIIRIIHKIKNIRRIPSNYTLSYRIRKKWNEDKKHLPLTKEHWELYDIIHRRLHNDLGEFPHIVNCRDYNDRIQWLKLFDQRTEIVSCSDKLLVRDYVKERIGEKYLTKLYQVCNKFGEINFEQLPDQFVIKTNHDSGSVFLIKDKIKINLKEIKEQTDQSLSRFYGWNNGEWSYKFIDPKIIVEEYIEPLSITPPPDYKFHCVDGKVMWLQYIFDRGKYTKETIIDAFGRVTDIHFDRNMQHIDTFIKPKKWDEMCSIAERLSKGWKYVRVDLYLIANQPIFGEMTFFPYYGAYKGEGQKKLGQLLDFDRKTFEPLIYQKNRKLCLSANSSGHANCPNV